MGGGGGRSPSSLPQRLWIGCGQILRPWGAGGEAGATSALTELVTSRRRKGQAGEPEGWVGDAAARQAGGSSLEVRAGDATPNAVPLLRGSWKNPTKPPGTGVAGRGAGQRLGAR